MSKVKKSRPRDINQWAKSIVDQATKQGEDAEKVKPAKIRKLKPVKGSK